MDFDELSLRISSLLRHAGLAQVPRAALTGILVLACVLVGVGALHFGSHTSDDYSLASADESQFEKQDTQTETQKILVDVEGSVLSPGLYELDADARVGDAVNAAGGLAADAVPAQINLARKIADGEQVYVASVDDAAVSLGQSSMSVGALGKGSEQGKININTASSDELQKLSGIGPSLAERIIDYRESNGRFSSVDDLQNVSGIGKSRFANIKDKICV